jgi:hypothetical protein
MFCFVFENSELKSQQPPCMYDYQGLTYSYQHLDHIPYLTVDMPNEVKLAYKTLDSLQRYSHIQDIKIFLERQTYNDTMRYIMKYYYKMLDYDPFIYLLTLYHWDDVGLLPVDINNMIQGTIKRVSPHPYMDMLLMRSSIIAHIFVEDTLTRNTPTATTYKSLMIASCNVLDTLKSKVLPYCKNVNTISRNNKFLDIPNCKLQFEYRLNWPRLTESEAIDDVDARILDSNDNQIWPPTLIENGQPWIKKGNEYIVFLKLDLICSDSSNSYISLSPFILNSKTCNMYPVEDNYILDTANELGLGTNVEIKTFKKALKYRIEEITNYGD